MPHLGSGVCILKEPYHVSLSIPHAARLYFH